MLDAYIIERIRRDQERRRRSGSQIPLHIESPPPETGRDRNNKKQEDQDENGSIVIDFTF